MSKTLFFLTTLTTLYKVMLLMELIFLCFNSSIPITNKSLAALDCKNEDLTGLFYVLWFVTGYL
jgi:hypothetical protein